MAIGNEMQTKKDDKLAIAKKEDTSKNPKIKDNKPNNTSSITANSKKIDNKPSDIAKVEDKKVEDKADKKDKKLEKPKKEEAIAKGLNLHASKKHCMYICSFIKNKKIDNAIAELQEVIKLKRPIPFKGEIPHRHELGGKPGRYPVKVSKQFIYILKALKGNVIVNGLDLDKTRIYFASASWASRPSKRGGGRHKRTNVILKSKEFPFVEGAKKQ